jgi:BON domain
MIRTSEYVDSRIGRAPRPRGRASSRPRPRSVRWFLGGVAVGAALAYAFDPGQGHRRRRLLVERAATTARRSSRRGARATRVAVARSQGHARGFAHWLRPALKEPPDDVALAHKVESVVFRDPTFPKGQISINAEQGEVFLRGQVDRPELIHELEEAVRNVPGVRGVENLLHLPGTPAPTRHVPRRGR